MDKGTLITTGKAKSLYETDDSVVERKSGYYTPEMSEHVSTKDNVVVF